MSIKNISAVVFYLLLFVCLVLFNHALLDYVDDDAYIHFRVVENLINYGKPYFNPSDAIRASSSSGWTITLYLMFSIIGINIKAVSTFNAAVTVLNVFVYSRIFDGFVGRKLFTNVLIVSLVVLPITASSSAGLMETPLAILILGTGILLYQRKTGLSFLFFGIAGFFRPEMGLFLVVFAAYGIYKKTLPIRSIISYTLLGMTPFLLYNEYFFGTNLPHAIRAKSLVYLLTPDWVLYFAIKPLPPGGLAGAVIELALILCLSVIVAVYAAKYKEAQPDILTPMLVSGVGVLLVYLLREVLVFNWYVPIFAVPIFMSLSMLAMARRSGTLGVLVMIALSPYILEFATTLYAVRGDRSSYFYFDCGARTGKYLELGRRLWSKYPDCTLMSSEIGGLGYGFKGYIYDACGLVSEGALKYHPMKVPGERSNGALGAIPPGYVREVKPDIIVSYDCFAEALLRSSILREYISIKEPAFTEKDAVSLGEHCWWGDTDIYIYIRRDKYSGAF